MKSDRTVTHAALYLLLLGIMSGCGSDKKSEEVTNTSPVPESITVTLDEDTTTMLRLTATDPQGDTLTYTITSQPQHGTLSALVDNVTTYTPDANYAGSDTFTFKASDGELDSTSGLVSLTISPQNDPPVSSTVTVSTAHNEAVDINLIATDVDGDALTFEIVQGPESGTLSALTNGVVSYTPGTVYTSSDTFTYLANDGTVNSETARVTVTIAPVVAAPQEAGSVVDGENIVFSWAAVEGAANYTVCYAKQPISSLSACQTLYQGQLVQSVTSNFITVESPDHGMPYYFRAAAVSDDGLIGDMSDEVASTLKIALNDTGVSYRVDGAVGRDVTDDDDSDGYRGFSFTKLSSEGVALAADAADWACVKDNVTGLTWEVKTTDGGLHDSGDMFTWYNTEAHNNGGSSGDTGALDICFGYSADKLGSFCNTDYFIRRVNASALCGISDWRMPTVDELHTLRIYGSDMSIDTSYFPNSQSASYWTASPTFDADNAWVSVSSWDAKVTPHFVRAVSSR
ncbi:DUF1566 domain-containing protein [Leucothrix mucor]|uniref:Lcl C-terminal domain-containing protein n=1 Tax=Leucothrix mucor TaxID=45248 RepID=UPI0003B33097|nr:DUF1566 domain-containing protein [Leucothrix mucor]